MNNTGELLYSRYQQFKDASTFPLITDPSLRAGDVLFNVASGLLVRVVGDPGARSFLTIVGGPVYPAPYIVAALPVPTQNGQLLWAANGRMGAEAPGAGTGVLVEGKTAGPAGIGWYVVGTDLLVTA